MLNMGSVQQICDVLRLKIDAGELNPGQKLPSTRALASDLGASRSTVVSAYEQLASEGYIETAPGAPARVALNFVPAAKSPIPDNQPGCSAQVIGLWTTYCGIAVTCTA
jgi:GntR family transcriptional regulator / MocR family aminotransferase